MKRFHACICYVGLLPVASLAGPTAPSERDLHAAACVAALEVNTDALVKQVRAGRSELRPLLQERMQDGVAFIGAAYVRGLRDKKRARALLTQASEAQKSLTADELSARQDACAAEGLQLLASATFIERLLVWHLTGNRMNKVLSE